jgi:hypothetical protein
MKITGPFKVSGNYQPARDVEIARGRDGANLVRLTLAAGVLAVAVVGVAVLVPRRRYAMLGEPLRRAAQSSLVSTVVLWFVGLWHSTAPRPPVFNDLRPLDEF